MAALTAAAVLLVAAFHSVRLDDAYITYRYAQNLSRGRGLVFNAGDPILGTTAPGHALVGAVAHRLAGDAALPSVMAGLGALAWLAQALLVYAWLRRSWGRAAALLPALAVGAGLARAHLWVSLETNLVAALGLGGIVLAARGRPRASAAILALATIVRPDAALLAVAVLGAHVIERRWRAWPALAAYLATLAPWLVFATWTFGSPIPHSASAKIGASSAAAYLGHALSHLPRMVAPWTRLADGGTTPGPLAPLTDVALWGLAIFGAVALVRRAPRHAVLPAFLALHVAAYVVLHPDPAFAWHLYPAVLAFGVLGCVGLAAVIERVPPGARVVRVAFPIVLVATLAWDPARFAIGHERLPWFGSRDRIYRTLAREICTRSRPGEMVSAEEVGTLAYHCDRPVHDHPGLVSRHPEAEFWRAVDRRPTPIGWIVLNQAGERAVGHLLRDRPVVVLEHERWRLYLYDVR